MKITITDPVMLRCLPNCGSEIFIVEKGKGHIFKSGDRAILTGLVDFPEYNGSSVEITNIREDGPYGRAYYIKGAINKVINWTYEYRLGRMV